jgi:hypothetical protein
LPDFAFAGLDFDFAGLDFDFDLLAFFFLLAMGERLFRSVCVRGVFTPR